MVGINSPSLRGIGKSHICNSILMNLHKKEEIMIKTKKLFGIEGHHILSYYLNISIYPYNYQFFPLFLTNTEKGVFKE